MRRIGLYVLGLAFTTLVTTVATAPFTVYHFNRFPLYSIVANALAVPDKSSPETAIPRTLPQRS